MCFHVQFCLGYSQLRDFILWWCPYIMLFIQFWLNIEENFTLLQRGDSDIFYSIIFTGCNVYAQLDLGTFIRISIILMQLYRYICYIVYIHKLSVCRYTISYVCLKHPVNMLLSRGTAYVISIIKEHANGY